MTNLRETHPQDGTGRSLRMPGAISAWRVGNPSTVDARSAHWGSQQHEAGLIFLEKAIPGNNNIKMLAWLAAATEQS